MQTEDKKSAATPEPALSQTINKDDSGSGLLAVGLASLALCLGGYAFYKTTFSEAKPAAGFYVVDSDRLAAAYINEAMLKGRDQDPFQLQQQLEQNMNQIRTKLQNMADSGMVVMQRSAVLTYPPGADLTDKIAADLGINLALVPNTAPAAAGAAPLAPAAMATHETASGDAELD